MVMFFLFLTVAAYSFVVGMVFNCITAVSTLWLLVLYFWSIISLVAEKVRERTFKQHVLRTRECFPASLQIRSCLT